MKEFERNPETSLMSGGKLADIPQPYRFKFPNDHELRGVRIHIYSYQGIVYGAKHYFPEVIEIDNPIWNPNLEYDGLPIGWSILHDHPTKAKGLVFDGYITNSKVQARQWIQKIWDENFEDGKHIPIEIYDGEFKWLKYQIREGD